MTNEEIRNYKLCNEELFIELNELRNKFASTDDNKIFDFIANSYYLISLYREEYFRRFNTELKKYLEGQQFDLLFMLNFIAELKDQLYALNKASLKTQIRVNSKKAKNEKSMPLWIVIEEYLKKVELLWLKGDDEGRRDKKSAIKEIWDECGNEINKKLKKLGTKKMTLGAFDAKFEFYLKLCKKQNNGITLTGKKLEIYSKTQNR